MRRSALLLLAASAALLGPSSTTGCSTDAPAASAVRPLGTDVPISGNVKVDHLDGPVDVVRDSFGMIHIYATSMTDAMRVQAYQVARDRTVQLELIRRFSEGTIAEVYGGVEPGAIDNDISQRTIGLLRTGQKIYDGLAKDSEVKAWLDAFADGVSQFYARVQSGDEELPKSMVGFSADYLTPWTGADSLAIARYQSQNLSFDADSDISRQNFLDAAKKAFDPASADAKLKARAGFFHDLLRFQPLDPTTTVSGFSNDATHTQAWQLGANEHKFAPGEVHAMHVDAGLIHATDGWRKAQAEGERFFGDLPTRGSNNWVVSPSKSTTGHPLVNNDPHLSLSAPSVFWMVHVSVKAPAGKDASKNAEFAGLSFPGIPGIILGFNEHVAWGVTTAGWDVTDVYQEKLNAAGTAVSFNGADVPIQKIHETIKINGSPPLEYDVLEVPHHGPIVPNIVNHAVVAPDPTKGALSYRWTGLDPSSELTTVKELIYSKTVEDVRSALRSFGVGGQNWVAADDQGNTFYSAQTRIPKRDKRAFTWDPVKYEGTLPMFVLPGDGTAEWTGDLEEAFIPHGKNPQAGFFASANGDPLGVTLDNDPSNDKLPNGDPAYVGGDFDLGFRVGRITKLLKDKATLSPDDMASIQADVHSGFGERLAPKLIEAIDAAAAEQATAGTHPDLAAVVADPRYATAGLPDLKAWLVRWGQESDYSAESGVSPDDAAILPDGKESAASQATLLFNAWLVRMGMLTFDDELAALGGPGFSVPTGLCYLMTAPKIDLATLDATSNESILFDDLNTPEVETRNERAVRALLDAVDYLNGKLGADRSKWRWGTLHTLRFSSLISLWGTLSIPPAGDSTFPNGFPRHGDLYGVDAANYGSHPGKYADLGFSYGSGPAQRMVADVFAPAPVVKNALPGGEIWDNASPHFRDDAELWRRNQARPAWILRADVIKDAKERIAYDR